MAKDKKKKKSKNNVNIELKNMSDESIIDFENDPNKSKIGLVNAKVKAGKN